MRRVNIITYDLIKECYGAELKHHEHRKGEMLLLLIGSTMWENPTTKITLGYPPKFKQFRIR